MDAPRLPPESARALGQIERDTAELVAHVEGVLGLTLPDEARTRLVDHALRCETAEAARALRALNFYYPN
ncbi:MAG TPA: hypothetical protein VF546_13945 [Pyrinomonadaceae bacterium]|jgi:hypothetical protein